MNSAAVAMPVEPTKEMWNGLARDIVVWRGFYRPTGAALHKHLRALGREIPDWLEKEIPNVEHVPPAGSVAVAIYRAMIDVLPEQASAGVFNGFLGEAG